MGTVPKNPYIEDYLAALAERTMPSTVDTYGPILRRLDRLLPAGLVKANAEELRQAISYGERAGRALRRAAVRSFFAWANDPNDPIMDWNPALLIPTVRVPRTGGRAATTDEVVDILTRARDPYRVWFVLAAGAGLRCVEISRLNREHITRDTIWVNGKGGKRRQVDTHELVWETVKDLPRGPVARRLDGQRADRKLLDQRGNRHLQVVLGYDMLAMHSLRRWYGDHIHAAAGGDVFVTQELLGHASPDTTLVYVNVTADKKRAATSALPLPMSA